MGEQNLQKINYIGMSTTVHDSSVAIVNSEGKVVFAEATERYLQYKRAMNCVPDVYMHIGEIIEKYCEPDARLVVAHSWSDEIINVGHSINKHADGVLESDLRKYLPEGYLNFLEFNKFLADGMINTQPMVNSTLRYELVCNDKLKALANFEERKYDHHLTHAATTCMTSPFKKCACAILDGFGEGSASNAFTYENGEITHIEPQDIGKKRVLGSFGFFYNILCDVCGFGLFTGEEWKVMGLAAYGKLNEEYYELFHKILDVDGLNATTPLLMEYAAAIKKLYQLKRKPNQPAIEMADLAFTGQTVFSELVFKYLNNIHEITGMDSIALGGGAFLNSWTNGEIEANTGFKNVYIFSAPGDDGNSIGAALLAYKEDNPDFVPAGEFQSPYLGNSISNTAYEHFKEFGGMDCLIEETTDEDVCKKAAKLLADGHIIGWVQGRAEFGPRALGNRSILADARAKDCKDKINSRVKFREEFRPFAPSILHEHGAEYFENYVDTPYMERTLRFNPSIMEKVPGVVHKNDTGRLQSVHKEYNEKYYNLISEFYDITGVPLILNTSFNVMGKPIIDTFNDALSVFFTSGLDALIVGNTIIYKGYMK